jgi:hypothetical protein
MLVCLLVLYSVNFEEDTCADEKEEFMVYPTDHCMTYSSTSINMTKDGDDAGFTINYFLYNYNQWRDDNFCAFGVDREEHHDYICHPQNYTDRQFIDHPYYNGNYYDDDYYDAYYTENSGGRQNTPERYLKYSPVTKTPVEPPSAKPVSGYFHVKYYGQLDCGGAMVHAQGAQLDTCFHFSGRGASSWMLTNVNGTGRLFSVFFTGC